MQPQCAAVGRRFAGRVVGARLPVRCSLPLPVARCQWVRAHLGRHSRAGGGLGGAAMARQLSSSQWRRRRGGAARQHARAEDEVTAGSEAVPCSAGLPTTLRRCRRLCPVPSSFLTCSANAVPSGAGVETEGAIVHIDLTAPAPVDAAICLLSVWGFRAASAHRPRPGRLQSACVRAYFWPSLPLVLVNP